MSDKSPEPTDRLARSPLLMSAADTGLLVIDMQQKLLPHIADSERVVWNCRRLIDAFALFEATVATTEQYPQGLGSTDARLAERLPPPSEKISFSCGSCGSIFNDFGAKGIGKLLLAGIETHVCVQQTAYDLQAAGFSVYLAVDAVGSRHAIDHETALRRLDACGVTLTTTEAALFEICPDAAAPKFKQLSQLVRELPPSAHSETPDA